MLNGRDAIRSYFSKLGLREEVADVYAALHAHGPQTLSELARTSGVERTRIYRLMPELTRCNLIEVESDYKRGIVKAAPISNLEILISKKEQELQALQHDLPLLEQALTVGSANASKTHVQFYRGEHGVKQLFWNETKASTEVLAILSENMQVRTKNKFFERWVARCNENGIRFRGIVSDAFLATQKQWYGDPHVHRLSSWEMTYVEPGVFPVVLTTVVYDDVVAYSDWNAEPFGIEIHDQQIANTQRNLFEMLWRTAKPLPSNKIP